MGIEIEREPIELINSIGFFPFLVFLMKSTKTVHPDWMHGLLALKGACFLEKAQKACIPIGCTLFRSPTTVGARGLRNLGFQPRFRINSAAF